MLYSQDSSLRPPSCCCALGAPGAALPPCPGERSHSSPSLLASCAAQQPHQQVRGVGLTSPQHQTVPPPDDRLTKRQTWAAQAAKHGKQSKRLVSASRSLSEAVASSGG